MRSSIFTVPAATAATNFNVNLPGFNNVAIGSSWSLATTNPEVLYVTRTNFGGINQFYVGTTVTSSNTQLNGTVTSVTDSGFFVTLAPGVSALPSNTDTLTITPTLPTNSTVIPVNSLVGLVVGDSITGTGINGGTVITATAVTPTTSTITISKPTTAVLANLAALQEPAQSAYLVYPVDQYVAPVELSIQPIDAGSQVSVQATVLPLSEIDGPNAIWGTYNSDAGSATLGTTGTVNTYSGKVVTAVRFVNAGPACRVSLAEGGIIS